jgi:hypothetical protein
MSKDSQTEVQRATIKSFISAFQNTLSIRACSVFSILPLSGRIA